MSILCSKIWNQNQIGKLKKHHNTHTQSQTGKNDGIEMFRLFEIDSIGAHKLIDYIEFTWKSVCIIGDHVILNQLNLLG